MKMKTLLIVTLFFILNCEKKESSSTEELQSEVSNMLSAALAEAGVSSPTAKKTNTTMYPLNLVGSLEASEQVMTAEEQITAIEDQSQKPTIDRCFEGINLDVGLTETQLSCFGPNVEISGASYPFESSVTIGTFTGSDSFQNIQGSNGRAPKGDLGIWSATEASGEACISAKMNTLVNDASKTVFVTEKLFAAVLCVANHSNVALPTVGTSVNLLSLVSGRLAGVTFGTASLSNVSSGSSGANTYTMSLGGTINSGTFLLTSTTTKSDSTVSGRIYGYKPNIGSGGQQANSELAVFSVVYNQTASSHKVLMRAAVASNVSGAFDANHDLNFNSVSGNNYYYILSDIEPVSNLGKLYMAWQAGGGDSHTRVFRTETSTSGGTDSGFGYFGYGDKINQGTPSLGTIRGMICNWAATKGGLFDHTTDFKTNIVQSQKIQRDNSTGVFTPSENKISYAPTFTCNNNRKDNSSVGTFTVTTLSGNPPNETLTSDVKSFVTTFVYDLVTLNSGGYSDVGTITVPSY